LVKVLNVCADPPPGTYTNRGAKQVLVCDLGLS
jgi:hypothetical protein